MVRIFGFRYDSRLSLVSPLQQSGRDRSTLVETWADTEMRLKRKKRNSNRILMLSYPPPITRIAVHPAASFICLRIAVRMRPETGRPQSNRGETSRTPHRSI